MNPVIILDARGNPLLRCSSREELMRDQRYQQILAAVASTTVACGCSRPPLPLAIVRESETWVTRARAGERALHAEGCGAIEPEPAPSRSTAVEVPADVQAAQCAFAQAYGRQFTSPERSLLTFCHWVEEALQERLDGLDPQPHRLGARTAIAANEPLPENSNIGRDAPNVPVRRAYQEGGFRDELWPIPLRQLYGRIQPNGRSVLGAHLVCGLYADDGSNVWRRLWVMPIAEAEGWVHPVSSVPERSLVRLLHDAKLAFFKPAMPWPSTTIPEGDWRGILTMLAEAKEWPQTIVRLPTGKYCLVDVSHTDEFDYRMDLVAALDRRAALEDRHGLEWAVLCPGSRGFTIDFRSRTLELAPLLTATREPDAA